MSTPEQGSVNRRTFLRWGAVAAAAPAVAPLSRMALADTATPVSSAVVEPDRNVQEVTIAQLQALMQHGRLTSLELVQAYKRRIAVLDQNPHGPHLRSVIELNPDAEKIAKALDEERRKKGPRGPLHGIPVLIKDNIDTFDSMQTTAGSLALLGTKPQQDSFMAQSLRSAGAVILGKTNLSEWANFRSTRSTSGWSGRGRQTRNPYVLSFDPCGSSSGSGAAVSANLCVAALGTETDGSIICPSTMNGVVGIKPTVGLTSRGGVVPISHSQDTVGPIARTVTDAATLLGALTGVDPRDPATSAPGRKAFSDYTQFLDPHGLQGARIGVARQTLFGYSPEADAITEAAIGVLKAQGATIVDPADIPTANDIATSPDEFTVLLYEFKADLNTYLSSRIPNPAFPNEPQVKTLADAIDYNNAHAAVEMPYFGQEIFELAQAKGPLTDQEYLTALANDHQRGRQDGIDAVLTQYNLDALVVPAGSPAFPIDLVNGDHFLGGSTSPAAIAGYPMITVPAGFAFGVLPVGIAFIGAAWSEPTLIKLAYAYEQATKARKPPTFIPILDLP